jgi:hypothetical protein
MGLCDTDAPLASRTAWRDATEKASDPQKRILNRSFCLIPDEAKCRVTTWTCRALCFERVRHRAMQSINSCGWGCCVVCESYAFFMEVEMSCLVPGVDY